jgi:hypothetical protein
MKMVSVVLFALFLVSFAAAQQRWTKAYGGTRKDEGFSVQQTSDGGYIAAGYTASFGAGDSDVYLIKTNASGDTLWTRAFGGANADQAFTIKQTADSGYIVAGYTTSFGASGYDAWLIKTNASGDTLWTRTYGGTNDDLGTSVQQTADGGYIVAGWTGSFGAGNEDIYLVKTNASGNTLWTRTFGGANTDEAYSVRQTADSGYIIAGWTNSFGSGNGDVYLIKTNASGDTLWTRTFGGVGDDAGYSTQQTSEGGYIIAGYTASFGAGSHDFYLVKTNASGDTLWTRTFGGVGDEDGHSVQPTVDGGYVIAGQTTSYGAGSDDVYLVKTDSSGDTLWTRTFGGSYIDVSSSVRQTADGGYIIAGYTAPPASSGNVYLIKTDENGSLAVEVGRADQRAVAGSLRVVPTPFASSARVLGHEAEQFSLYDISGKLVQTCRGDRVGDKLSPGVYFINPEGAHSQSVRVVNVK